MIALIDGPTPTDDNEWHQELKDWGLPIPLSPQRSEPTLIELWQENATALEWWLSLPQFLRWHNGICLGMDVQAVAADLQLSQRSYSPDDYDRLKVIAATVTESVNLRNESKP
ncbi:hypothetical protein [Thaumasiovibrio subtropicus]|uniref:hypothetical protein n=1 Tax=Thaumasiovibrio subtropicus TaxID=1891207 RepID=UPI000B34B42E|nr:hypothetical protein [Thaumasiovibrio subtropicus]